MEYADVIWSGHLGSDLLEHVQYEAAKVVTGAIKGTSRQRLLEELGWESMKTRRIIHRIVLFYKIVNNYCPALIIIIIIMIITLFKSQVYLAEHRGSTNWGDRKSNQHKSNQIKSNVGFW